MAVYRDFPVTRILSMLGSDNLLPAILFRTSRRQCDEDIETLASGRVWKLSIEQQKDLLAEVERAIASYNIDSSVITGHPHYGALLTTGVGAHHAGQLLLWRLLLEELMTRGALRMLIATGTVAAGVDFPARTVVVTAHSKRGSEGFNTLTSSEFMQMSGRAGRRGKDAVGVCLIAPGVYSDARVLFEVAKRPAEPLKSAYFAAPSTVLNLLRYRNVDDLRYTVERSLASFLDRKEALKLRTEGTEEEQLVLSKDTISKDARKRESRKARRKVREAEMLEGKQKLLLEQSLAALQELGFVEGSGLTEKGSWAANLCTSMVLELAEAISEHLFDDLNSDELVALLASVCGDSHRKYLTIKQNPIKKEYFKKFSEIVTRVKRIYRSPATAEIEVIPEAGVTVLAWLESPDWQQFSSLLRLGGVAEGDVARLVSQCADCLNQLARLEATHPDLARLASETRIRILRPPLSEGIV